MTPAAVHAFPSRPYLSVAVATRWASLAVFALLVGACVPPALAKAGICSELLMDAECARYRQQLQAAVGDAQRKRIDADYRDLLESRRQACRYPDAQDWPRLRANLERAGLPTDLLIGAEGFEDIRR